MSKPTTSEYVRGSLYGIASVSMWTAWILAVRLGIRTSLTPWDITAIRFGVAGLILLPYLLKKGLAVDRLGWLGLAAILLGGAPTVLVSYGGLVFAPAAHAASLFTALIPLYVAILAAVVLGEPFTVAKRIGLALVVAGVLGIVWGAGGTIGSRQNIGHAMFISAGLLFAGYTVAMRKARLDGLHAAAIAAVGSLISYVPVYAIVSGAHLFNAPWSDLVLQAFVHGILCAVISLMLYGRAISLLGASNGSAFAALAPAITAILGVPLLGEWSATTDWIAMLLISGGVYIASGGLLPATRLWRRRRQTVEFGGSVVVESQAIAIIRGASSRQVEETFRALVDLWQPTIRLAGVVAEGHGLPDRFCNAGFLRNLTTEERFPIFRDPGPNTDICHLEGTDALAAAEAVKQDISAGCDLVLLSKFGRLEAEGKGLTGAFEAAIDKTIPLVTSVSPAFDKAWRDFADRPFAILPADVTVIDAWQRSVRSAATTTHPVP